MGPASGGGGFDHADGSSGAPPTHSQTHSVFQPGMGPQDIGTAYRPYHESGRQMTYMDRLAEQKQVEEVCFWPTGPTKIHKLKFHCCNMCFPVG